MKRILILIVLLFCIPYLYAQPGYGYKLNGNLNDIDSTQIKKCLKEESYCHFGTIEIDSTTNLSRLDQLNSTKSLSLDFRFKKMPKEFFELDLSQVESLFMSCANMEDLSNFPNMPNLKNLVVSGFEGDSLSIKNKLPKLNKLDINYANNLVDIQDVLINKNLEYIVFRDCDKIRLQNISSQYVTTLYLKYSYNLQIDLSDLANFPNLESVSLSNVNLEQLPDNLPKSLRAMILTNTATNLNTLNKLTTLKNFEYLKLMSSGFLWEK